MSIYILLAIILFIYMTGYFVIAVVQKRNDIADEAWGLGFVLLCWMALMLHGLSQVGVLVTLCVTVWGVRLYRHIHARHQDKAEDPRYAQWRQEWKYFRIRSFLQVFFLQGVLLYCVALPAMSAILAKGSFDLITLAGFAIWMFGFFFEAKADAQLASFIAKEENAGKLMTQGLWKYSRHPNYFGEVTLWWGIYIVALSVGAHPLTILGPLTITILILFVSGIPMTEKRYRGREDFEAYAQKTSPFFPLPPRA